MAIFNSYVTNYQRVVMIWIPGRSQIRPVDRIFVMSQSRLTWLGRDLKLQQSGYVELLCKRWIWWTAYLWISESCLYIIFIYIYIYILYYIIYIYIYLVWSHICDWVALHGLSTPQYTPWHREALRSGPAPTHSWHPERPNFFFTPWDTRAQDFQWIGLGENLLV